MIIDLPWPSKDLHPNARVHWARKAKATKAARADAINCAKAAKATRIDAERLSVLATFSPPDNRRRDVDGMLTNIKAYLDGIADVVGIDDHKWKLSIETAPAIKGGRVRITLTPLSLGQSDVR